MELALGQKGPVAPPPELNQPYQTAVHAITHWKDVIAATHWHLVNRGEVDGADFYVNKHELGHIHLDGRVHLATSQLLCDELKRRGLAEEFSFVGYEHWVSYEIRSSIEAKSRYLAVSSQLFAFTGNGRTTIANSN